SLVLTFPATQAQGAPAGVTLPASDLVRWAGIYRDGLTGQTATLSVAENALGQPRATGGPNIPWVPLGGARFRSPQGDATFSGSLGRRAITIVRGTGDTAHYAEVKPVASRVPVEDYSGTYASDELDVRLVVAVRDGKLLLRRRPADEFELIPAFADAFRAPAAGITSMVFARDAKGTVTGFAIFAGRVFDVRFTRQR
ncbi:MAG TPA: hypothetical protein VIP11_24520, partial [Gemmatimonadaceae bacterium]